MNVELVKRRLHHHDTGTFAVNRQKLNVGEGETQAVGQYLTGISLGTSEDDRTSRAIRVRDLLMRVYIGYFPIGSTTTLIPGQVRMLIVHDRQPEAAYDPVEEADEQMDLSATDGSGVTLLQKILQDATDPVRSFPNRNYFHRFNILYDDQVLVGAAGQTVEPSDFEWAVGHPFVEAAVPLELDLRYDGTGNRLSDHGNGAIYAIFVAQYSQDQTVNGNKVFTDGIGGAFSHTGNAAVEGMSVQTHFRLRFHDL